MIATLFLVLTAPVPNVQTERVEVGELNHVIGDEGKIRLVQFITWRWYSQFPSHASHHVAEWYSVGEDYRLETRRGDVVVVFRNRQGVVCEAVCRTFRETWTHNDPEVDDRRVWREEHRRPYFKSGTR